MSQETVKRNKIKNYFLSGILYILGITITIEIGLQALLFLYNLPNKTKENTIDIYGRHLLTPYKGKGWAKDYFIEHNKIFSSYWTSYKDFISWRTKKFHGKCININADGIRKTWNNSIVHNDQNTSIFVFGGSTTWGVGARDDFTIPSYLSKRFSNSGKVATVENYGEAGYTFTQEIIHFLLLLREGKKPDIAIFYDGVNDVYGAFQSGIPGSTQNTARIKAKLEAKRISNINHIKMGLKGVVEDHCLIYEIIKKASNYISGDIGETEVATNFTDEQLKNLAKGICDHYIKSKLLLERICTVYDIKYICLWQPVSLTEEWLTDEERSVDPRIQSRPLGLLYNYSRDHFQSIKLPNFFDISQTLGERKNTVYIDFCHVSEQGNKIIAEKIYDLLIEQNLI